MSDDRSFEYTAPILYFFIGGLVGAGAALLFAPQSGQATRDQLGRRLREGAESARELKEQLVQKSEQLRQGASRLRDKTATALASVGRATPEEIS